MEINKMCPAIMDYITKPENGVWATTYNGTKLQNNEQLAIRVLVQQNDEVYKSFEYITIKNNRPISTLKTENVIVNEKCDIEEINAINTMSSSMCEAAQTKTRNTIGICKGDLLFEDSFNTTLKQSMWNYDIRLRLDGDDTEEFVLFNDYEANCFITDGVLNILPTIASENIRMGTIELGEKCTPVSNPLHECKVTAGGQYKFLPPIYSAQIHTKNTFNFVFGHIEIKAKLPRGDWLIPYVMLQSMSGGTHASQIRIAFIRGNVFLMNERNEDINGNHLYGGAIWWQGADRNIAIKNHTLESHYGNDFHVYSLIWTDDYIALAVDGIEYGKIDDTVVLENFRQEFYIVLGVSAGGHLEFPDNIKTASMQNQKPWTNTSPKAAFDFWKKREEWRTTWNGAQALKIDYIRVYAV